ncbi:capsular polysaccharide transport system permease protein [Litoreibacter janthinus]|uniref:Transport permease protein n=2 Tax=Litoreibacter janthinus TaxID=670154 RepID=A0A1I6ID94_9RHOB|nr:capsular polysaccharide transport system permease protein [Litoreibacter janthinus]
MAVARRRVPFQTVRVIAALLMREVSTTFGRSSLGYLWAVLEPIGIIVVFTLAFSIIFKQPPLGDSFPLFYATGYLPFGMYNSAQSKISTSIAQNKALLFYPAVTHTDVVLGRFTLIALTEFTVALIVFSGLLIYSGVNSVASFPHVFMALGMALVLGASVGLMNATLFEIFPSWRSIWKILTRPMFFISAIFYLYDTLPSDFQAVLWWNPLIHIIGSLRVGFYPEYEGAYISWLYVIMLSLVLMTIGLVNLRTSNKFIINN